MGKSSAPNHKLSCFVFSLTDVKVCLLFHRSLHIKSRHEYELCLKFGEGDYFDVS